MSELTNLRNIGDTVAKRLEEIGVFTKIDLRKVGSATAYRKIRANHPESQLPVCYYLYSLEGALKNKDWRSFSEKQKANMRRRAGVI
ncbi:MAG: TfoX/Sxy family DNA transformation protein [Pseudomonadota bacterium]